jgi:hypothetical protein
MKSSDVISVSLYVTQKRKHKNKTRKFSYFTSEKEVGGYRQCGCGGRGGGGGE